MFTRAAIIITATAILLAVQPVIAQQSSKSADHIVQQYPAGFEHVESAVAMLDRLSAAIESGPQASGLAVELTLASATSSGGWILLTQLSQTWAGSDWLNESLVHELWCGDWVWSCPSSRCKRVFASQTA